MINKKTNKFNFLSFFSPCIYLFIYLYFYNIYLSIRPWKYTNVFLEKSINTLKQNLLRYPIWIKIHSHICIYLSIYVNIYLSIFKNAISSTSQKTAWLWDFSFFLAHSYILTDFLKLWRGKFITVIESYIRSPFYSKILFLS